MAAKSIEKVLEAHSDEWMAIAGVVGVGIGLCDGEPCIRVLVSRKTAEIANRIPAAIEGFVVDVEETGRFEAYDSPE